MVRAETTKEPPSVWLVTCCLILSSAAALALPAMAQADLASEVTQGQTIAQSVESGQRSCGELSDTDFELVGEYAMDRYLADRTAHEAMNARMVQMMGEAGEVAMHTALGHRYTGCPGGPDGAWAMPMAGMMGGSGGYGAGYGTPHDYGDDHFGDGMMGFDGGNDDGLDPITVVLIALGAALLGGLLVAGAFKLGRRSADAGARGGPD